MRINTFLDNRTFSPLESELDAVAADPSERVYDNHPRLPDDAVRDVFGKSFRSDREPSFSIQQHSRVDLGEQPVALIVVLADLLKFISSSSLYSLLKQTTIVIIYYSSKFLSERGKKAAF